MKLRKLIAMLLVMALFTTTTGASLASTLRLPSDLKAIEDGAFEGDGALDDVVLPEGLKTIGSRAFADSSVQHINLPNSLEYIAPDAFEGIWPWFEAEWGTYGFQWMVDRHYIVFAEAERIQTDYWKVWWLPVEGVFKYKIYTFLDENCKYLYNEDEIGECEYFVTLDPSIPYWFVFEYELDGETYRSDPFTAEQPELLPAPENLTLEVNQDGMVQPYWDAVPGATGYRVYTSTDSSEWSMDTDWFSFEGSPEDHDFVEMWLDEGQTLYFWVCAENENGPNRRAFDLVTRYGDRLPLDSLYISEVEALSEEGIEDEEVLAFIREYNASLEKFNGMVAEYNQGVDEACTAVEALAANLSDMSYEETDDALFYSIGGSQFVIDRSLAGEELEDITDIVPAEDGVAMIAMRDEEEAFYIFVTEGEVRITQNWESGQKSLMTPGQRFAPEENKVVWEIEQEVWEIGQQDLDNLTTLFSQQWDIMVNSVAVMKNNAAKMIDLLETDIWNLKPEGEKIFNLNKFFRSKEYREASQRLVKARISLKAWQSVSAAFAAVDIASIIDSLRSLSARWTKVNEIGRHGHLTEMDYFETRYPYAVQVRRDLFVLKPLYWAKGAMTALQIIADIAAIVALIGSGGAAAPVSILVIIVPYGLGKILDILDKELYDRICENDRKIHSTVIGTVKDIDTRKALSGVVVTIDKNKASNSVTTNQYGYYEYPVSPDDPVSLWFIKNGYETNGFVATGTPFLPVRKDMELKARYGYIEGTLIDVPTGKPMENTLIKYSNGSSDYTDSEGHFSLRVPINFKNGKVTIDQYGWKPYEHSITLNTEGQTENLGDIKLQWSHGIHGTMLYDDGSPMEGAYIHWKKSSITHGSFYTDSNGEYWFHDVYPNTNYIIEWHPNHGIYVDYHLTYLKDFNVLIKDGEVTELGTLKWVNTEGMNTVNVGAYIPGDKWEWVDKQNCVFSWEGRTAKGGTDYNPGFTCVFPNDSVTIHFSGDAVRKSDGVTVHIDESRTFHLSDKNKLGDFHFPITPSPYPW